MIIINGKNTRNRIMAGICFLLIFLVFSVVSMKAQETEQPVLLDEELVLTESESVPEEESYALEDEENAVIEEPATAMEETGFTKKEPVQRPNFFIAPLAQILGYSRVGSAVGAGFSLSSGDGIAIGFSFLYFIDAEYVTTMEITALMRFYLFGPDAITGPFVQLNIGSSTFAYKSLVPFPAKAGTLSAGISAGWRIPFKEQWYLEYNIRVGFPYIAGVGASAAFRF